MGRFEVWVNSVMVGLSALESGDPPMGVAIGRLHPNDSYAAFQAQIIAAKGENLDGLTVSVRLQGGQELVCAGCHIIDFSPDVGPDGIEASVLGLSEPPYDELFPEHVLKYRNAFKSNESK
jgi:hypothetical protein